VYLGIDREREIGLTISYNRFWWLTHNTNCRRGNSLAWWQNAPALNPKMRRGLRVLSIYWEIDEHE
jgi:hypothetical protein